MDYKKPRDENDKKEQVKKYVDDTFSRCEMAEHTGNVSVSLSFFKGKVQAAKATWEEGIVK